MKRTIDQDNMSNAYWSNISLYKSFLGATLISSLVLLADINQFLILCIEKIGKNSFMVIAAATIAVMIVMLIKRHFVDLLKIPCGNVSDEILIAICLATIIIGISEQLFYLLCSYKLLILICIGIFSAVLLGARIYFCSRKSKSINAQTSGVVDLKELLDGKVESKRCPLMFKEEAVDYDLLERNALIKTIYSSIDGCNPQHSYVIGLKGSWGSGKTTILHILKEKLYGNPKDVVVIDNFDPWIFGSQEALLIAMYDEILSRIGIKYSSYSSRTMIRRLKGTIIDEYKLTGILEDIFVVESGDYESVKRMKQRMSMFLRQLNKTVVFMIDNIDRAETDNILFLFKLIGTVFDLPNVVYVLAYDEGRIREVFSNINKINPQYIEKIVQQEIPIPEISRKTKVRLYERCLQETLYYYGVDYEKNKEYQSVIKIICQTVTNLRQLKRLLNTAFINTFWYDEALYKPHLLAIETIRFLEPGLYDEIKRNQKFFVSRDYSILYDQSSYKTKSVPFNEEGKKFFEELFRKYTGYEEVLSELFPYVKRYLGGFELREEYELKDNDTKHDLIASIASAKYFDLYFSYGENNFIKIFASVDAFIKMINKIGHIQGISITERAIESIKEEEQLEWLNRLQSKLEQIERDKRYIVAKGICNKYQYFTSAEVGVYSSKVQRVVSVMVTLLKDAESTQIAELLREVSQNYNIFILAELQRISNGHVQRGNKQYMLLRRAAEKEYRQLCNKIVSQKINIYSDELYQRGQIWSLCMGFSENERNIFRRYMNEIANCDNIFRIIEDVIEETITEKGSEYYIEEKNVMLLFNNKSRVDELVKRALPKTGGEKQILLIWNKMKKENVKA